MCKSCDTVVREAARALKASKRKTRPCGACNSTGKYYGRGVIENGVRQAELAPLAQPTKGFTGKCFQCNGTGQQTLSDIARTQRYWAHHARINA